MAITTATIQVRRGLKRDFDPDKMLPGEWAVTTDTETDNQIVWMCFRPGVVKRMGTYDDFKAQILELSEEILKEYEASFKEIKEYMEGLEASAESSKNTAVAKAGEAASSASAAAGSADTATQKASQASASEAAAAQSSAESENYSLTSKSYAVGTGGQVRPDDDTDSSKGYYELAKRLAQGYNGVIPMGTITFAQLSLEENQVPKYMFNISDDFISDDRFADGGGKYYGPGNNVIYTAEGKWDVLTASSVTGVKGAAETSYRQGNVEITPDNVGAVAKAFLQYSASTKNEALEKLNNPTLIFGAAGRPYCIEFSDNVGDSPLGGGSSSIYGYTYGTGLYGAQMAIKYGHSGNKIIKIRAQEGGVWTGLME